VGEYAAACLAGVFSIHDAVSLLIARCRLMEALPPGAMMVVGLSERAARLYAGESLSVAAVNGASQCVLAGDEAAVQALRKRLEREGISCRQLNNSYALHSKLVEPILEQFGEVARRCAFQPPKIPFISSVSGTWITDEEATSADYWIRQLRETVQFAKGVEELWRGGERIWLEVGPGQTLSQLVRSNQKVTGQEVIEGLSPEQEEMGRVGMLEKVARVWVKGVKVDWARLYERENRRRVPLPTYPFERRRYWLEPKKARTRDGTSQKSGLALHDGASFYTPSWKLSLPPRAVKAATETRAGLCLLAFVDALGVGDEVLRLWARAGHDVIKVTAGEKFEQVKDGVYQIEPTTRRDYLSLFSRINSGHRRPDAIIHLWGMETERHARPAASPDLSGGVGFSSVLHLRQTIEEQDWAAEALGLWVVSNNTQQVESADAPCAEKAGVLGLCETIRREMPGVRCRLIDVSPLPSDARRRDELAAQLFAEMWANTTEEVIAYRGKRRWVRSLEPVRLEQDVEPVRPLRAGGVYLINGGASAIGLKLASHLARSVREPKLVLLDGASALCHPSAESSTMTNNSNHDSARLCKQIREAAGAASSADVSIIHATLNDEGEMLRAITETAGRFGHLDGLIHVVGCSDGARSRRRFALDDGAAEVERQYRAVVEEVSALERALRGRALDFCLLYLPEATGDWTDEAAHACVESFIEGFTPLQNSNGQVPWISLRGTEPCDELAGRAEVLNGAFAAQATPPSRAETILRAVCLFPGGHLTGAGCSSSPGRDPVVGELQATSADSVRTSSPDLGQGSTKPQDSFLAPMNETERIIARMWEGILGVERVSLHDSFFNLGGDSLLGVELVSLLCDQFQVELSLGDLSESYTVATLAQLVEKAQHAQAITRAH
jgi:acyl transferase domain-containing protein/acyl carrier protein